jgi:hypothetical protein
MQMSSTVERILIWAGFVGMLMLFVGMALAQMLPPPSPDLTTAQIADFYQSHTNAFRIGTLFLGFGASLLAPWIAVIARRMHAIPDHGPLTSYAFLGLGMLVMFQIVMGTTLGQVTAFRPDRPVGDTQALSDLFLIPFISPAYLFEVQMLVMAVAVFADRSAVPVFPRWIAYLCLWVATGSFCGVLVIFFKTGPFAWIGLFGWWIPVAVFAIWVVGISACLLRRPGVSAIAAQPVPAPVGG